MRRQILTAFFVASSLFAAASAQAAPRLAVPIDHAARVQLSGPAGSVIVANPAIADVVVVDARTLFVQGKGYGQTEVVAVDPLGRTIWSGLVTVTEPETGQVSIYRGAAATQMACGPVCAPSQHASNQSGGHSGALSQIPGHTPPAAGGGAAPLPEADPQSGGNGPAPR